MKANSQQLKKHSQLQRSLDYTKNQIDQVNSQIEVLNKIKRRHEIGRDKLQEQIRNLNKETSEK